MSDETLVTNEVSENEYVGRWVITFADMITLLFIFFIYITLVNNIPGVNFEIVETEVKEGARTLELEAKLEFPTDFIVEVPFLVRGNAEVGVDHSLKDDVIYIPAGQESHSISFDILDDELHEADKTIEVIMRGPVRNAHPGQKKTVHTYLLIDNDAPPLVAWETDEIKVIETAGAVSFQARLDRESGLETQIAYQVDDSQAPDLVHNLESGVLKIPAGEIQGTVTFRLEATPEWQPERTIDLTFDEITNGTTDTNRPQKLRIVIVDSLRLKDCRAIQRYMTQFPETFRDFELRSDPLRCIISLPQEFLFGSGRAQMSTEASQELIPLFKTIQTQYPQNLIVVEGHTDDKPFDANDPLQTDCDRKFCNNWELSSARATSMGLFLVKSVGFAQQQISVTGFADTRPRVPIEGLPNKQLQAAREANRRVELIVMNPQRRGQQTQVLLGEPN